MGQGVSQGVGKDKGVGKGVAAADCSSLFGAVLYVLVGVLVGAGLDVSMGVGILAREGGDAGDWSTQYVRDHRVVVLDVGVNVVMVVVVSS